MTESRFDCSPYWLRVREAKDFSHGFLVERGDKENKETLVFYFQVACLGFGTIVESERICSVVIDSVALVIIYFS